MIRLDKSLYDPTISLRVRLNRWYRCWYRLNSVYMPDYLITPFISMTTSLEYESRWR